MAPEHCTGTRGRKSAAEASAGLTTSHPPGTSVSRSRIPVVEVSSPNPFGGVPERPLAIDPPLGHVQRFKVDVGRQNRQGPPRPVGKQTIEDERGGIGLFAGGAPSAPESELQHPLRAARGDG